LSNLFSFLFPLPSSGLFSLCFFSPSTPYDTLERIPLCLSTNPAHTLHSATPFSLYSRLTSLPALLCHRAHTFGTLSFFFTIHPSTSGPESLFRVFDFDSLLICVSFYHYFQPFFYHHFHRSGFTPHYPFLFFSFLLLLTVCFFDTNNWRCLLFSIISWSLSFSFSSSVPFFLPLSPFLSLFLLLALTSCFPLLFFFLLPSCITNLFSPGAGFTLYLRISG